MKPSIALLSIWFSLAACSATNNSYDENQYLCGDGLKSDQPYLTVISSKNQAIQGANLKAWDLSKEIPEMVDDAFTSQGCFQENSNKTWLIAAPTLKEASIIEPYYEKGATTLHTWPTQQVDIYCQDRQHIPPTFHLIDLVDLSKVQHPEGIAIHWHSPELGQTEQETNALSLKEQHQDLLNLADQDLTINFEIHDLVADTVRHKSCQLTIDSKAPQPVILNLPEPTVYQNMPTYAVPRDHLLRLGTVNESEEEPSLVYEYCFQFVEDKPDFGALPGDKPLEACRADQIQVTSSQHPIVPASNEGLWVLRFRAKDKAGNRSPWQPPARLVYSDEAAFSKIQDLNRVDFLNYTSESKGGVFGLLQVAFAAIDIVESLKTEYERLRSEPYIDSILFAANVLFRTGSQVIGASSGTGGLAVVPGTNQIISGHGDGTVRIWENRDGKTEILGEMQGHENRSIPYFSLSKDQKLLAAVHVNERPIVWNLETKEQAAIIPVYLEQMPKISGNDDLSIIAATSWTTPTSVWARQDNGQYQLVSEIPLDHPQGHKDYIMGLDITPDQTSLVTASWDGTVKFWDMKTGEFQRELPPHEGGINTMVLSPDGSLVITGSKEGSVRVWRETSQTSQFLQPFHQDWVSGLAMSSTGDIVSIGNDETKLHWHLDNLEAQGVEYPAKGSSQSQIAIHSEGNFVVNSTSASQIEIQPLGGSSPYFNTFEPVTPFVSKRSLAIGQGRVAAGGVDSKIFVWDQETESLIRTIDVNSGTIYSVAWHPTKAHLLYAGTKDRNLTLWNTDTGDLLKTFSLDQDSIYTVLVSPKHPDLVITGTFNGRIDVWDTNSGDIVRTKQIKKDFIRLAITTDGQRLVSSSAAGIVHVIDFQSFETITTFTNPAGSILLSDIAISPDDQFMSLSDFRGNIVTWRMDTYELHNQLKISQNIIWDIEYTGEGHKLAVANDDHTISFWDIRGGFNYGLPFVAHRMRTRGVRVSPDQGRFYSISDDGTLKRWTVPLNLGFQDAKQQLLDLTIFSERDLQ